MKLSLLKAADEFDIINDETYLYYNKETGEFDFYSDSLYADPDAFEDPEYFEDDCWVECPSQWDINEYEMMKDFAETVADQHKAELLWLALKGKGAFRRFKDTIYNTEIQDEWFAFKRKAYAEVAREWCEDNGLEYLDDIDEIKPVPK